ncbi:MAG: hypothetical protein LBR56_08675 [Sporomusaceae bacterium]|jgi:hypothetical protein|nr:hypothetical protein [Sporomusaceae bacterium]
MEKNIEPTDLSLEFLKKFFTKTKEREKAEPFNNFFDSYIKNLRKRAQEEEQQERRRLASILMKLSVGIILSSDEMQFLKSHAPLYYTQAMYQQRKKHTATSAAEAGNVEAIRPVERIRFRR